MRVVRRLCPGWTRAAGAAGVAGASRPMPPDIPDVRVSGPSAAYRLGGAPLLQPDAFGLRDPAPGVAHAGLPPPGSAARLEPAHATRAPPGRRGETLAPGEWVVGVTNADEKPLPSVLARTRHFGHRGGVPDPGSRARSAGAFPFRARPCAKTRPRRRVRPAACAPAGGACEGAVCRCARPPSVSSDADSRTEGGSRSPASLGFQVGERCVPPAIDLRDGAPSPRRSRSRWAAGRTRARSSRNRSAPTRRRTRTSWCSSCRTRRRPRASLAMFVARATEDELGRPRARRARALRGDRRGARRLQRGNPRRAARLRRVSGERSASVAATRAPHRAGCPLRLRQGGDPAGGAPAGRTFRRNTKRFEPRTRRRVRRGGVEPPRGQRGRRAGRAAPRRVLSRSGRAPGCAAVRLRVLGRGRVSTSRTPRARTPDARGPGRARAPRTKPARTAKTP